jgi:hypothetical protein
LCSLALWQTVTARAQEPSRSPSPLRTVPLSGQPSPGPGPAGAPRVQLEQRGQRGLAFRVSRAAGSSARPARRVPQWRACLLALSESVRRAVNLEGPWAASWPRSSPDSESDLGNRDWQRGANCHGAHCPPTLGFRAASFGSASTAKMALEVLLSTGGTAMRKGALSVLRARWSFMTPPENQLS